MSGRTITVPSADEVPDGPEFAAWFSRTVEGAPALPPPVEPPRPAFVGAYLDGEILEAAPEQLLPPAMPDRSLALAGLFENLNCPTAAWCIRHDHRTAAEAITTEIKMLGDEVFARSVAVAVEAWASGADVGPYVDAAFREWRRVDGQPEDTLITDHTAQETTDVR